MTIKRSQLSIDRERFYNTEIAPVLRTLRSKCFEKGINFLAVSEWDVPHSLDGVDWNVRDRIFTNRADSTTGPDESDISDLLFGLNELARRGYLCRTVTTLRTTAGERLVRRTLTQGE